jgi:hypothetical protein
LGAYAPGGKVFDVGGATRAAVAAIRSGTPAVDAGPSGKLDNGIGSLMRILPLALVERSVSDERLIEMAHLASRVSHSHPRCQVACALYSLVVRRLHAGLSDRTTALGDARSRLRDFYVDRGPTAHLTALDELEDWTGRSGRGYVLDSFCPRGTPSPAPSPVATPWSAPSDTATTRTRPPPSLAASPGPTSASMTSRPTGEQAFETHRSSVR